MNEINNNIDSVHNLINEKLSNNDLEGALLDLSKLAQNDGSPEIKQFLILKKAEYQQLQKEELSGVSTYDELLRRRIKIIAALYEINSKIIVDNATKMKITGEAFIASETEANKLFDIVDVITMVRNDLSGNLAEFK